jgi:hypothetical protein
LAKAFKHVIVLLFSVAQADSVVIDVGSELSTDLDTVGEPVLLRGVWRIFPQHLCINPPKNSHESSSPTVLLRIRTKKLQTYLYNVIEKSNTACDVSHLFPATSQFIVGSIVK